jgi:hypothetical protein
MKKRNVFLLGLLAVLLAMGLVLASCGPNDDDSNNNNGGNPQNNHDPNLVGKWCSDQERAELGWYSYWIKSDGTFDYGNGPGTWSTSNGVLTFNFTYTGGSGTMSYSINGNILVLTKITGTGYDTGTFYR